MVKKAQNIFFKIVKILTTLLDRVKNSKNYGCKQKSVQDDDFFETENFENVRESVVAESVVAESVVAESVVVSL